MQAAHGEMLDDVPFYLDGWPTAYLPLGVNAIERIAPAMEKTLSVINQLEAEGLIGRYAIGGAMAATRYIEPIQTYDLDIFIMLPVASSGLISTSPIYSYLTQQGYMSEGACIIIEGWPVQFLPVYNPLTEEAVARAVEVRFGTVPTRVLGAEYLAAIMLETGRPKDHARLVQFFEFNALDRAALEEIVARHGLSPKWEAFRKRFMSGES